MKGARATAHRSMITYQDKPWLQHYDPQVPHSLAPYPDFPLHQYLVEAAQRHGDATATITSARLPLVGRVKTALDYRTLNSLSDALAAALVDHGLRKGDRVAIIMPNCAQFVIAFFAILKAGGVVVATNPTYPPQRLQEQLIDSGARAAIVLSLFYNNLKAAQPGTPVEHVIVTNIKEYLPGSARFLFGIAKEKKKAIASSCKAATTGCKTSWRVTPASGPMYQFPATISPSSSTPGGRPASRKRRCPPIRRWSRTRSSAGRGWRAPITKKSSWPRSRSFTSSAWSRS